MNEKEMSDYLSGKNDKPVSIKRYTNIKEEKKELPSHLKVITDKINKNTYNMVTVDSDDIL